MRKLIVVIAIFLCIGGVVFAQSQPSPPPSTAKARDKDQQKALTQNQPSASDKRGTKNFPLVVEMNNLPNTDVITKELQTDRENHSTSDRWMWFFNFLLVLVGSGQVGVLLYTALVTNKAANAAKAAAEALPAVERAYVFLATEIRHKQTPNAPPLPGDIVEVQFAFKNHGKTPAILTKIEAEIRTVTELPTEIRKNAIEMPPTLIISSGETTPYFSCRNLVTPDNWPKINMTRDLLLLFVGAVEYHDIFGNQHTTGFCLDWGPMGGGFTPTPTTKLNYYK